MSDDTQARRFIESQGVKPIRTLREYAEHIRSQKQKPKKKSRRRGYDPDNPLEHVEQATVVKWAFLYRKQRPELQNLFAIPNQGAARLKNLQTEGVMRGVSDLFLAVPMLRVGGPWDHNSRTHSHLHGLFIEMKRRKKYKVSGEQYDFMDRMSRAGYAVAIAHGAEEAWQAILKYLQVKDPRK